MRKKWVYQQRLSRSSGASIGEDKGPALTIGDRVNEIIKAKNTKKNWNAPRCVQCVNKDPSASFAFYGQCEAVGKSFEDGHWWCGKHDNAAIAKREAKQEERAKADKAKWAARHRLNTAAHIAPALIKALEEIRDGHNDPRTLAAEVLAELSC